MQTMPSVPSLADLLESEAGAPLKDLFREQSIPAGKLLPDDGEDQILIVQHGRLRVYLASEERELSLTYLTPGDAFSTHTRASLSAAEDSVVLFSPRHVVQQKFAAFPSLQEAVFRVLAATLARTITMIEDLAFHPVRGRLARYLLRAAERQGVPVQPDTRVRLDLGMEEVAALIGTTRQTASTEFNAMVRDGVIARPGRGEIIIKRPKKLQIWAGEDVISL